MQNIAFCDPNIADEVDQLDSGTGQLKAVFLKALEKKPKNRYQEITDFTGDLMDAMK